MLRYDHIVTLATHNLSYTHTNIYATYLCVYALIGYAFSYVLDYQTTFPLCPMLWCHAYMYAMYLSGYASTGYAFSYVPDTQITFQSFH